MGTCYIINRHHSLTRQQVLSIKIDDWLIVSDEDKIEKNHTIHTADSVGCVVDGHTTWLSFSGDVCTFAEVFGGNRSDALDLIKDELGVEFISEHDDEFGYHQFVVDVKTATPIEVKGEWEVYGNDEWVELYNKPNNSFYSHVWAERNTYNIDDMIAAVE